MKCKQYREWISKRVDLEIGHALTKELEEHLAVCPECRAFLDRMESLDRGLRVITAARTPVGLAERVKERVARDRERQLGRGLLPTWTRVPLAAMIMLAAVGLGNAAGRSISSMILSESADNGAEYVLADQAPSFADVFMDNVTEENGR